MTYFPSGVPGTATITIASLKLQVVSEVARGTDGSYDRALIWVNKTWPSDDEQIPHANELADQMVEIISSARTMYAFDPALWSAQ